MFFKCIQFMQKVLNLCLERRFSVHSSIHLFDLVMFEESLTQAEPEITQP